MISTIFINNIIIIIVIIFVIIIIIIIIVVVINNINIIVSNIIIIIVIIVIVIVVSIVSNLKIILKANNTKKDRLFLSAAVATGSLPAPTHLRSRMISSSTALLQWTDPSLEASQRITDERYYNVYYQALPSGKNLSVIVKALQVTLYDLLPNKNYRFSVRTVKGSGTSPFSDSVSSRTPGQSGGLSVAIYENPINILGRNSFKSSVLNSLNNNLNNNLKYL